MLNKLDIQHSDHEGKRKVEGLLTTLCLNPFILTAVLECCSIMDVPETGWPTWWPNDSAFGVLFGGTTQDNCH